MKPAPTLTDTIAAIATPPGPGGVGIVRVSGPDAPALLRRVFRPRNPRAAFAGHHLHLGDIIGPDGMTLDEALAVHMPAPRSYTGEDVVEFQCHASPLVLQELVERLCALGARPAEPGEFTKRAFLAGRLDLTQAEAVLDLVSARTRPAAELAAAQLRGGLAREVAAIREALIELSARLEVAIDFPDEDEDLLDREAAARLVEERVRRPVRRLMAAADSGRLFREGARLVLTGLPNAGKSSLLNALLGEDRALVTPIPGTTRDSIEESLNLDGIPVRLADTAGLRPDADAALDPVELLGADRARRLIDAADCLILLVDAHAGIGEAERRLRAALGDRPLLLALNKRDLLSEDEFARVLEQAEELAGGRPVLGISAKNGEGLEALRDALRRLIAPPDSRLGTAGTVAHQTTPLAPNRRHRGLLAQADAACGACLEALAGGAPVDLLSVDVRSILEPIAAISGHSGPDEVLDAVFSRFCIGK